jgi:hypothetical protein
MDQNKVDKFELRRKAKEDMFKRVTEWDKGHSEDERRCIFNFAYDIGHSSGEYEVSSWYEKLVDFLDDLEYAKHKISL